MTIQPVDLTKVTVGQIAHFRCGGKARITKIDESMPTRAFIFDEGDIFWSMPRNGVISVAATPSPFDIIRIEDPPFDWDNVKQGMAFNLTPQLSLNTYRYVVHYVGRTNNGMVFENNSHPDSPKLEYHFLGEDMERAPTFDKIISKTIHN